MRRRHRRIDEARLDRHDRYAGMEQPVAEPWRNRSTPALGGAVHVVALPPAVSSHRGDHGDGSAPCRLEAVGERGEQRDGGEPKFTSMGATRVGRASPGSGPDPGARRGRAAPRPARRRRSRRRRPRLRSAGDRSRRAGRSCTPAAPRTRRSAATASRRSAIRAARKSRAPCAA